MFYYYARSTTNGYIFTMVVWILLVAICVFVALFYNTFKDLYDIYFCSMPPGPLSLPLIGGLYKLDRVTPHLSMIQLGETYGPIFSVRMGTMGKMVILQDMKHIKQVFDDPDCNDRPNMPVLDLLNNGADGIGSCRYDKRMRAMAQLFHQGIANLIKTNLHQHANHAYEQLFDKIRDERLGQEYYTKKDVFSTCTAVFTSLVYGFESEPLDSERVRSQYDDLMLLLKYLSPTHPINICPLTYYLPLESNNAVRQYVLRSERILNQSLVEHHQKFDGEIKDIMDIIVKNCNEDLTLKKELVDLDIDLPDMMKSVWTFFIAGCATIVDIIMWGMLFLAVNPEVQRKVQEEIDYVVRDLTKQGEDKSQLHYTRATLFEILRRSSQLVFGIPRVSAKHIKLDEFIIPKGTIIMFNQWTVHLNEKYWEDPFTVKPERFLDDNGKLLPSYHIFHQMPFIPFSFGKRKCLGRNLAIELLLDFFVGLLKRYNLNLPEGYTPDLTGKVVFNLETTPYPLIFTARQSTGGEETN